MLNLSHARKSQVLRDPFCFVDGDFAYDRAERCGVVVDGTIVVSPH